MLTAIIVIYFLVNLIGVVMFLRDIKTGKLPNSGKFEVVLGCILIALVGAAFYAVYLFSQAYAAIKAKLQKLKK